ncbi:MAG TPA: molybdopterin-dependent oxidoreductase, partial [Desulfobacteria bacterium]|nr:molybdopterin-dependent oxidoreductase [Desulfobacteria bacterium]
RARRAWEKAWKVSLSPDPGLDAVRMVEEAEKGNLRALYVMGENPVRSLPQQDRVKKALRGLDFLVVQDILNTETAQMAHMVLPGAAFSEKQGSFTSMEGRINRFKPVVTPPGESLPDWKILDDLSQGLGNRKPFGSLNRIREEMAHFIPPYADLIKPLEQQWAWVKNHCNTRLFSDDHEGALIPFSSLGKIQSETFNEAYPLTAVLGTQRFHLGSGTRTDSSRRIVNFHVPGTVAVSPEDSQSLNVKEGDRVRLESEQGLVMRKIHVEMNLPRGIVFLTTGVHGNDVLNLMALVGTEHSEYQGFNTCRVRLDRQEGEDETETD